MVDGGYSGVEPYERFMDNIYRPFLDRFINGLRSLPIRASLGSLPACPSPHGLSVL